VIRRSVLVVVALVAALALSSCATLTANNDVASVGDVSLDRPTFELYLREVLEINNPGGDNSRVSGDLARQAISQWIIEELSRQYLQGKGIAITDTDRSAAEAQLDAALAAQEEATISERTRQYLIESVAAHTVFAASQQSVALGPFAATLDVSVDSRYGYWDGTKGSVVGFG
jgi:hypothetical protein